GQRGGSACKTTAASGWSRSCNPAGTVPPRSRGSSTRCPRATWNCYVTTSRTVIGGVPRDPGTPGPSAGGRVGRPGVGRTNAFEAGRTRTGAGSASGHHGGRQQHRLVVGLTPCDRPPAGLGRFWARAAAGGGGRGLPTVSGG